MEKIKRAKGISIVLLFMMVLQLMMPVNFAYGDTIEGEQPLGNKGDFSGTTTGAAIRGFGAGRELGDIFSFEYMKVDETLIEDNDIITIEKDTSVEIKFLWDTETLAPPAKGGDTASIKLSSVFDTVGPFPAGKIIVKDVGAGPNDPGTDVGDYIIENGELKFTFNDDIETSAVQNGYVLLNFQFNLEKFKENIVQKIPFQDEKGSNLTVISRPAKVLSGITKDGNTNNDVKENAREINWGINVINTNDEKITGATVTDTLPLGLKDPKNFKVYELKIGLEGKVEKGDEVDESVISTPTGFPIPLGEMKPFSGYRIEFTTDIDYASATANNGVYSFNNKATFKHDNITEPLPADTTVGGLTRSDSIEKDGRVITNGMDGFENGKDKIRWTIDVNKNGQQIGNAIVNDDLPNGLKIDVSSIKVVKITQSGKNWVVGNDHPGPSITTGTGFPIGLGKLEPGDAYRIIFDTEVDWAEVGANYVKDNSFTNEATLLDGTEELDDDDANVTFERKPILEKVGASNVDYTNKTITWKVTVNEAKHPFSTLTLTDYLPKGLEIDNINTDVKITSDVEGYTDYSVNKSTATTAADGAEHDGKTKLVITLNNVGTQTLTITYTTRVTDFTINKFTNWVGMDGTGVGEGGGGRYIGVNPAANTYSKGTVSNGIDYVEKTMAWKLTVAPRREAIKSLRIEDTFSNKGMILLPGTVEVKISTQTEPLKVGVDYTLEPRTVDGKTGYEKGFIINVPTTSSAITQINDELTITYKTSYDPKYVDIVSGDSPDPHEKIVKKGNPATADGVYVNQAIFTGETVNGNPINETKDAYYKVVDGSWNSGKKEGQLISVDSEGKTVETNDWVSGAERRIAWQLYINYQEHDLGKIKVEDILQYVGDIDLNSIKVFEYTVNNSTGTTTKKPNSELAKDGNYNIEVTNKTDGTAGSKFELTFLNDVTKRYVIEFTTSVGEISENKYTNGATVSGGKLGDTIYPYSATVTYTKYNNFLDKKALVADSGKPVYTGDEVNWKVTVNDSVSIIHDAVVTDTISDGHVYKDKSLVIYKSQDVNNPEKALKEGIDYRLGIESKADGTTVLTVTLLLNPLEDTLVLNYTTVITTEKGSINNKVSLTGKSITTVTKETNSLSAKLFSSAGGEWASDKGALIVTKVDVKGVTITTGEATFELWYKLNGKDVQYIQVDGSDNVIPFTTVNGVLRIGNLPFKTYYLKEISAPGGYFKSNETLEVIVSKPYNKNDANAATATFKNVEETEVTATKIWSGGPAVKPTIKLQLYRNGSDKVGEAVELSNGTTSHIWNNLPKTDEAGNLYNYTVDEVETPENYGKGISANGLTITNTYNSPTTDVVGRKSWVGGENHRPESIELQLWKRLATGAEEKVGDSVRLNKGENAYTWKAMPVNDSNGYPYVYFVREVNVPEDYVASYSENARMTVTNTYVSPTTTVSAIKAWSGGSEEERPTVWFKLYRQIAGAESPEEVGDILELPNGTTEVSWSNIPERDEQGNAYTYFVKEVDADGNDFVPSGYRKSETGLTVTNTKTSSPGGGGGTTPVYGKVTVKKVDEDKKVLSGAEFTLYDSKGKVVGKAVTGSDGTVSFEELEPGEYVLKETKAPEGYVLDEKETDVTISANKTNSYTITNRKEEPKKPGRIEIIKTDEEGKLLSDAWFSLIDEKGSTLQNAGTVNGRVAFEDVPVGRYTVKEVQAPEGYELSGKAVTVTVERNRTVELSFVNKKSGTPVVPANGRISIGKVDENSNALAGAEFTLYDENNRIVETAVTDKDGKVVFENLKDGRYFVKETQAPEGYVLVNEAKIVDIAGGQTYSYKFKNVPESVLIEDPDVPMGWETIDEPDVPKGVGTLPNTGYILNTWILAALGLLLIAEGMFLRKRRRITN